MEESAHAVGKESAQAVGKESAQAESAQAARSNRGMGRMPHGAIEEKIRQLKHSRGGLKGTLTKTFDELERFINSNDDFQESEVRDRISYANELMSRFKTYHDAYHVLLENVEDVVESEAYFSVVEDRFSSVILRLEDLLRESWAGLRSGTAREEVEPEDSVSNVGSRARSKGARSRSSRVSSAVSKRSAASSAANSRIKVAARKAALEAKAASLQTFQDLEREEFLLKQRKETLKLHTELAVASAEERVFSDAEERVSLHLPYHYDI